MLIALILFGVIVYLAFKWATCKFDYFENQGIKFVKPYPFIGNCTWLLMRENVITVTQRYYQQFPNEKIYGLFQMRQPFYVIRDLDLLKHLTINKFEYFANHMNFIDFDHDRMSSNMLFFLQDHKWKQMRNALTPAFTGSKMRLMFDLIVQVGHQMSEHLTENYIKNGLQVYEIKDMFSRFTNDVIATCAFGFECNSFRNPNNEFFQISQHLIRFSNPVQVFKFLLIYFFPKFARIIGLELVPKRIRKLFYELIIENIKSRERKNIYRPDMINLLMQLKNNELVHSPEDDQVESDSVRSYDDVPAKTTWTDDELIAQCYMFFQAGLETTSGTLQFVAHELASNSDVQRKLLEEVDRIHKSLQGGSLTYDKMQSLRYLDMIISETLRKWPFLFVTERQCGKEFKYHGDDGLQFKVEKGSFIWIPIRALHMDEKYFPEPEKFIPERFSSKNCGAGAYMPFGIGPRTCIGNRFAMMEMKIAIYNILTKFTFEPCPETQIPIKLKNSIAGIALQKEIKLYLKPREKHINTK